MDKDAKGAKLACSYCGDRQPVKLIAGPAIFICSECVAASIEIARRGGPDVLRPTPEEDSGGYSWQRLPQKRVERREVPICTFCGRSESDLVQPPSVLGTRALICTQCLQLCEQIIAEHLATP